MNSQHQLKIPLVSVIMAVFNGGRYLSYSIESILNQSFTDFEFIIVDDCSTDSSGDICERYAIQDSRIKIIRNKQNKGLTRSLNLAFKMARGKYIARMDADDISLRNRFEKQIQTLETNPQIGVLGSFYQEIDGEGNLLSVARFPSEPIIVKWHLCFENPIPHPPIIARRKLMIKVGGYNERWDYSQDYDLFIRLSKISKLNNFPEILFHWRVHSNSISTKRNEIQRKYAIHISKIFIEELLNRPVPLEHIELLWVRNCENNDKSILLTRTLYELCKVILDEAAWSRKEKKTLRNYASKKLFNYIRPFLSQPPAWGIAIKLFFLYPSFFIQKAISIFTGVNN